MKSAESLLSFYNILRPIIDVGILAFILYKAYGILVKTNGIQIIKAAVIVLLSYALAILLNLDTLLWLLNLAAPVLIVGFAIVFQPEIRKLFLRLGQNQWFAFGSRSKHSYVDSVLIAAEICFPNKREVCLQFFYVIQNLTT